MNLFHCIYSNDANSLRRMLETGANVGQVDQKGNTPLSIAMLFGNSDIVAALLDAGANVNAPNHGNWTPLHSAAQAHNTEFVKWLLEKGASVDARDDHGKSPLHVAVINAKATNEVVNELIKWGADVNLENHLGISPKQLAHSISNYDVVSCFRTS